MRRRKVVHKSEVAKRLLVVEDIEEGELWEGTGSKLILFTAHLECFAELEYSEKAKSLLAELITFPMESL